MKVRRIRFTNAHDFKEIAIYPDATLRDMGSHPKLPGRWCILYIPMPGFVDSDGNPAEVQVSMHGLDMDFIGGGPNVSGFVSKGELAYEDWYRQNVSPEIRRADYDSGYDLRYKLSGEYVREEWQVI
jgi:hypothetical protein